MNAFNHLEIRALVLHDLDKAELVPKDYYGTLQERDIESAILDQMLGHKLRFSSSHSGIHIRYRRASDLLLQIGYYRVTTFRELLKQRGINTLRQTFGPRAATAPSLELFDDVLVIGDLNRILALMERNFPDVVRNYAACLPDDEKKAILALIGEKDQEAKMVEATLGSSSTISEDIKGIPKKRVIAAFEGVHFDESGWRKALASPPQWLKSCRVMPGNKANSALWNPVLIAVALLDKGISIKKLGAVFVGLRDWADEWEAKSDYFRDHHA